MQRGPCESRSDSLRGACSSNSSGLGLHRDLSIPVPGAFRKGSAPGMIRLNVFVEVRFDKACKLVFTTLAGRDTGNYQDSLEARQFPLWVLNCTSVHRLLVV
jgi:hypothetical protein